MRGIGEAYQSELLTLPEQFKVGGMKLWERLGFELSPEQQARVTAASTLSRRALEDLNLTLRDMSGAAITPQEADRLRAAMPDPERDSPSEFSAKYSDIVGSLQSAQQRYLEQLGVAAPQPQPGAAGGDPTVDGILQKYGL